MGLGVDDSAVFKAVLFNQVLHDFVVFEGIYPDICILLFYKIYGGVKNDFYLSVTCNPFGTLYNPLSIAQAINSPTVSTSIALSSGISIL